jgi:hypothetical protein
VNFSQAWDQIAFGQPACDFVREQLNREAEKKDQPYGFSTTRVKKVIFAANSDL